jgi:hypothetical protein
MTEMYSNNRLGQYSKYLDTTPTFVTYYSINQARSRADAGSGMINELIGANSPLRFNKITEFPVYKMQQLIPNGTFEDGFYDVELEISDITILPRTLKPRGDDFILIEMPNTPKLLFRVTNFKLNTVQSNDFYMLDADLYVVGDGANEIEKQVVETYRCVFENIGTQNNCFITDDTYNAAEGLLKTLNTLVHMYHDLYYYENHNIYAFIDYIYNDTTFVNPDPNWNQYAYIFSGSYVIDPMELRSPPPRDITHYDIYLIKFIMDSGIFFNSDDNSTTSIVTYDDFEPPRFDYMFNQTLWKALIDKSTVLLNNHMYYFNNGINKNTSIIKNNFPNGFDNTLVSLDSDVKGNYYFDKYLLDMLVNGRQEDTDKKKNKEIDIVNLEPLMKGGEELSLKDHIDINLYDYEKPEETKPDIDPDLKAIFDLIYNYINGIDFSIDGKMLIRYFNSPSLWKFRYHLIVIYILKKKYESIFA